MKRMIAVGAGLVGVSLFVAGAGCGDSGEKGGAGGASDATGSSTQAGPSGTMAGPTGSGSSTSSSNPTSTGAGTPGGIFEPLEPWTKDVSGLLPDPRSDAIIGALESAGGWGNGDAFQIDFTIPLFFADASTPRMTISGGSGYCYDGPDCDPVPLEMPVPAGANIEGSADLGCDVDNEDCHMLVVATDEKKLYEIYNATQQGGGIEALGAFVWDLTKAYPDSERGEQCTSADAGGFPIAGLLPTADEVAAGDVHHALRFILPNARMKADVYVHPASHAGGPSSDDPNAPPYGVRFRLKKDFDEGPYDDGEKVILDALKTYGMLLSDGGNIALTFADDRTTAHKWADVGISAQSFNAIPVSAFEVVDLSDEIPLTFDCVRNP